MGAIGRGRSAKLELNVCLLSIRGIYIPTRIIFNTKLSPPVLVTWIRLRLLAGQGWETPALSWDKLAALTGKSRGSFYKHLKQLRSSGVLHWHSTREKSIIISFPDERSDLVEIRPARCPRAEPRNFISKEAGMPESCSYFPAQIMGYLSYQTDEEDSTSAKAS